MQATLNDLSWKFAGMYREFLTALAGHFAVAVEGADPTSGKVRSKFRASLNESAHIHLAGFAVQIRAMTDEVKDLALDAQDGALSGSDRATLDQYVTDSLADVFDALSAILYRDVAVVERELRRLALNVELLQSTTGMSKVGALIKSKLARPSTMSFYQQDSLGRRRQSELFVQTMIRQHLVLTRVESSLFAIAKGGKDLAVVFRGDDLTGETFSITGGTPGYPSYADIRNEIFHPNSATRVEAA